jgi:hypothetical protein
VALASYWGGPEDPGEWVEIERRFRDGHTQTWWALEAECAPYGPEKRSRLVVATTDPASLPHLTSWYLATNLPAPGSKKAEQSESEAADLAEVVRLYSLRSWIEQSYKQVKNSLGWAHYQVRKDVSIRRHWQLVCCAFTFCWWTCAGSLEATTSPPGATFKEGTETPATSMKVAGREKRKVQKGRPQERPLCWPVALLRVRSWLEPWVMLWRHWRAYSGRPPPKELQKLLEWVFSGRGLYLYAR